MLNPDNAVRLLLEHMPPSLLEAVRFRAPVHMGPGVNLPHKIHTYLSVSLSYVPCIRPQSNLVRNAWLDFDRRARWAFYFEENPSESTSKLGYDPDFELNNAKRVHINPKVPTAIDKGLLVGQEFVEEFL